MLGYTITISLKNSEFVLKNKSKKMIVPTNDEDKIYIEALKLLDLALKEKIRLIGVSLSDLIPMQQYYEQMDIYDLLKIKKNQSGELISRLNQIAGQNIFMKAKDALRKKE
ncbi:dNA polymerase IV [Firmicutes bacterium CAG:631]|nr:dNA polymerase IV [Firmicutes bacterium CAG:631]